MTPSCLALKPKLAVPPATLIWPPPVALLGAGWGQVRPPGVFPGGWSALQSAARSWISLMTNQPYESPPKPAKFPDWRVSRGRSPFLVAFFLLFVQVLALEWFLRRRWGMV